MLTHVFIPKSRIILGSKTPKQCNPGYYTNTTRHYACLPCLPGFYCLPINLTMTPYPGITTCPGGYYCPSMTGLNWLPCPRGTYSNSTGLSSVSQCLDCPGGNYCDQLNGLVPAGICDGGYYCESAVDRKDPIYSNGSVVFNNCTRGIHTGMYFIFYKS